MADNKSASGDKAAASSQARARDHVGPSAPEYSPTAGELEILENIIKHLGCPPGEAREVAKREILETVLAHRQMATTTLAKRSDDRKQLEQIVDVAEKLIDTTENPPLFGLYQKHDALRSTWNTRNDARRLLQSARWQKHDDKPEKIADVNLLTACFLIFERYRPGVASTHTNTDFEAFVRGVHTLASASGEGKNLGRAIKEIVPFLREEAKTRKGIGPFDVWQEGYAGATVRVCIPGTENLASLYTDEAMTIPAANPQTLGRKTDKKGITYGKWKKPIFIDEAFDLYITKQTL